MSSPSSHLSLTFADSVTVLMDACGLPVSARTAFDARLRQLQRHGVPARDDATSRIRYGIAELAAFATATKLMDAFMVPALAARYVVERWSELAPCMLAGARDALPASYLARRSIPSESFAVFGSNALAQMGKRHRHDERYAEPLGTVRVVDEKRAAATAAALGGASLMIDAGTYMPIVVKSWARILSVTETELAAELDRLRYVKH